MDYVVGILIGVIAGAIGVFFILNFSGKSALAKANAEADRMRESAQREAETKAKEIELSARQEQMKAKEKFETDLDSTRRKITEQEISLNRRDETLTRKLDTLNVKERKIDDQDRTLAKREKDVTGKEQLLDGALKEQREKLLAITNMNFDQARELLLRRVEDECKMEVGDLVKTITDQATEEAREKSRQIILQAIQRYASDQTAAHTVSSVVLPDEAVKGRVIGKEGRNIRAFEKTTGVDVIIDETPGVVTVSCFDPVRREIARISLERLVQDGRIHPARIEEMVAGVSKEMDEDLIKIGKEALQEANLPNVARQILPMLGRLHFRTSYGQNILKHSLEVAYISQVIAGELGLDSALARRAGFLHDIGKAMDHEVEGGHPQIGADFLKKFNEPEAVLNAAAGHHGDIPATTPYTIIVMAADAISAARPGARRESLERYVKRLQDLEDLATQFEGVRQAYAIQAGREVRVIVDAKMLDDRGSSKLARDISKKIETELNYPGEIKVTVLREMRSVEYAR